MSPGRTLDIANWRPCRVECLVKSEVRKKVLTHSHGVGKKAVYVVHRRETISEGHLSRFTLDEWSGGRAVGETETEMNIICAKLINETTCLFFKFARPTSDCCDNRSDIYCLFISEFFVFLWGIVGVPSTLNVKTLPSFLNQTFSQNWAQLVWQTISPRPPPYVHLPLQQPLT
jgi:hypothetical protein